MRLQRPRHPGKSALRRYLAIEPLESRLALFAPTVDLVSDEFDGNFAPGDLSLREAIFFTNNSSGPNTINFAPSLSGKTIQLNDELVVEEDVTINGPGADKLSITGLGNHRLFSVVESFRNVPNVEFVGLKLTGANATVDGAAIQSVGANVVVRDCWLTGNTTSRAGGAVAVVGASMNPGTPTFTLINSTVSNNTASKNGGGLSVSGGGRLNVINATVSGNSACRPGWRAVCRQRHRDGYE